MTEQTRDNPSRSGRKQFLLIVAIAAVSFGGAFLLFDVARQGGLWGTTNHGAFVEPPLTAGDLGVRDAAGQPPAADVWWLWVVPAGSCDGPCRDALHQLRQLHALLNRDAARVRRGLLTAPGAAIDPAIRAEYPRLAALSGNLEPLSAGIYVVDPLGNLVFHYTWEQAGEPVLDDLKRLLKVSQIG